MNLFLEIEAKSLCNERRTRCIVSNYMRTSTAECFAKMRPITRRGNILVYIIAP